jgi:molecular chaperone GrpE
MTDERPPAGPVTGEEPPCSANRTARGDSSPVPPAGDSPDRDGSAADDVEEDFEALLADAHKERDEYLELAKRTKADFENFRKRMTADVQAAAVRGKVQMARDVVPVLDDLERALEAADLDPQGDSEDPLAHGVILVCRSLHETLKRNGIEQVDPKGEKFDPNQHEALSTLAVEGAESGTVVEVMQKGYRMDGQLIRPARVVVSE